MLSEPTTSVPLNFDARNWSERCEFTNFTDEELGVAAADELGAGAVALGAGVADGAGAVIDGDFAGGAGSVAAGGADGFGDGGVPSATAAPSIKPVMAVVTMSFFNIRDPPDSNWNSESPRCLDQPAAS